jgi:hypothetical protein
MVGLLAQGKMPFRSKGERRAKERAKLRAKRRAKGRAKRRTTNCELDGEPQGESGAWNWLVALRFGDAVAACP